MARQYPTIPCDGLVLAGGRSTRMGYPKETLKIAGNTTLLERALATLKGAVDGSVYVSRPFGQSVASPWELPDARAGEGPLAGIGEGLIRCRSPFLAVLAVDLPAVPPELFRLLYDAARPGDAGVFPFAGHRQQPLAGLWSATLAGKISEALTAGHRRVMDVLAGEAVRWVDIAHPEWLINLNTPTDVEHFRHRDGDAPSWPG